MNTKRMTAGFLILASLISLNGAVADTTDPRVARLSYEGSGLAEKPPEFGEVWFTFQVTCRQSADDVRKVIEAVSGNVWKSIANNTAAQTEKRKPYWGNIGGISEIAGSRLQVTQPTRNSNNVVVAGTVKRIDVCAGKEIALRAKTATVYAGSQRFGIRTDDLDFVEGLLKSVQAIAQSKARDSVKISTTPISYDVTENTKREMLADTLNKARLEATGTNSKFASDLRTLKFKNAHYLGHHAAYPAGYSPVVGNAVTRGQAPKVTLELPLVYTIYSEAKDLIDATNSKVEGIRSEYEITGKATTDADFGEVNASLNVVCQTTKANAAQALDPLATDLLKDLRTFQGTRPATESDRFENNEAGNPQEYFPYQPVEWDVTKPNSPAIRYLNTCTNDLIDAPASGNTNDLPSFWSVDRSFALKSKDFNALLDLAEKLQARYNTSTLRTDETRVAVSDVTGQVSEATKRTLAIAARENATAYVLNANGPLAQDARAHGFTNAHLVDIRVGQPAMHNKSFARGAAMESMAAPAAPGGAANDLTVNIVHKPNEERPQFQMNRTYLFDFNVITENYLPYLSPSKPKPAPVTIAPKN